MEKIIREVCTDTVNSAITAQLNGGDRIELCQALSDDGLTPAYSLLEYCCKELNIPVCVLVRPRGGDFCYNEVEYRLIKEDVRHCKEAGAEAVVTGFLTPGGEVDKVKLKEVATLAAPMQLVFHRAFDYTNDLSAALEDLIECGCKRVLTSGGAKSAFEGAEVLRKLNEQAAGRIEILAGGGVNPENVADIIRISGCRQVHFSGKTTIKGYNGRKHTETAPDSVKAIKEITDKL
jgi:copper homeostasis protein